MFTANDVPDQTGKIFFITGANAGIGFETAKVLAAKNARILLGCRNTAKAEQAKKALLQYSPTADIDIVTLDLGDLDSVRAAAAIVNNEPRLDVLINNAGIMTPPLERTKQGFESQWGVNHLGPFVLTGLLLDKLMATHNSRVVNTTSIAHHAGVIDFKDINADKSYSSHRRYSQSKLANLLFSYELQRRLDDIGSYVKSVACHPGVADTELTRHLPSWVQFSAPIVRLMFNTQQQGAWPTLMAATAVYIKGGDLCGPRKRRQTAGHAVLVKPHRKAQDKILAAKVWDLSCQMTGSKLLNHYF